MTNCTFTCCRRLALLLAASGLLSGCSSMVSSATAGLAESLTTAVLQQNDPETVRQGAPAYLLLVDGLIADNPDSVDLLLAGANLYSSYAGTFVDEPERQARLAEKGRDYGWQALCRADRSACGVWSAPYSEFEEVVNSIGPRSIDALYGSATAWVTWIRANNDDWNAIGDKARVEAMLLRVVALEPEYDDGSPYLYLGRLDTLLPEAMGGKPERGRENFERAIELSDGRNLMAKVLLAEKYARLVFDRELHDRLCREVLEADPEAGEFTLINALAQEQAAALLADSEDYFGD
jgi:uncharacterized protein YceK